MPDVVSEAPAMPMLTVIGNFSPSTTGAQSRICCRSRSANCVAAGSVVSGSSSANSSPPMRADHVGVALGGETDRGQRLQHAIARGVAVSVVDVLEVVDVHHHHGQRPHVALAARQFRLRQRFEVAPIVKAGQPIDRGQCFQIGGTLIGPAALLDGERQPAQQQ